MKKAKSIKNILTLPTDFQEVMISNELKIEKGIINVELGMEYYDSINKVDLHKYYLEKSTNLLTNPKIIEVLDKLDKLDKQGININDTNDFKLFKQDYFNKNSDKPQIKRRKSFDLKSKNEENEETDTYRPLLTENTDNYRCLLTEDYGLSHYKSNQTINRQLTTRDSIALKGENKLFCLNQVKRISNNLDIKIKKINDNISETLFQQKEQFEKLKILKLKSKNSLNNTTNIIDIRSNYMSTPSLRQDKVKDTYCSENDELIISYKKQTELAIRSMMLKDIEEFIENDMKEMHAALNEIKASYDDELSNLDENINYNIVKALKDDLKIELDNLKEQYEEKRAIGVEKIRARYLKNKV